MRWRRAGTDKDREDPRGQWKGYGWEKGLNVINGVKVGAADGRRENNGSVEKPSFVEMGVW